ncbi:MAG: hypothetical protein ACREIH_03295 [Nitrospiraceae bacterium]
MGKQGGTRTRKGTNPMTPIRSNVGAIGPQQVVSGIDTSHDLQERVAGRADELYKLRGRQDGHASAVGLEAQKAGVAPTTTAEELRSRVAATQWTPASPTITGG